MIVLVVKAPRVVALDDAAGRRKSGRKEKPAHLHRRNLFVTRTEEDDEERISMINWFYEVKLL